MKTKRAMLTNNDASYAYDDANILSMYLKEINRIPLLTPEEELSLAKRAQKGDEFARKRMIEANLRFVVNVAKKYQNQGMPLIDLINEGNIGLMTALDKFDPDKGYHFISYAVWWIRQSVMKAINEKSRAVRLPLNRTNELLQIQKAQRSLMKDLSTDDPTMEDIGTLTGFEPEHVSNLLSISRDLISLDAPVFNDGSTSNIGDFIEDESQNPEQSLMDASLKEDVRSLLATLSDKEREIIELRFGLEGKTPMSLKEIGELYNLTKERIRQIEKKALERLRNPSKSKMVESYIA
ncbi:MULTISPECIES: sigma-70 family RNA polymerase sigma factor [Sphaerochaeta]|jgi:RNA polymerase primary sigma factor|uniref:RNA polymerase sigma factor SigA n=1 Tax=bioreactor metagenome TaxID=1076179 RepID=A0A644VKM1_9ZZZZ|nr:MULTISPECIES: sigma-70 family RNA polymerase sigma factor [Sphaerochaeta]MDT3358524.1 sigma-70 family RNA polymerase sigma factor [Spirochaetota bacterium]MDD2395202.1 sigma-70 family RNA polymerase sigma factor [Sphaerochaeta sp.]MDD3423111.1 sigma-70 family RNA polymerase sigma factor [Sphaerochaeta sp.]MDD3455986.1 sigma-70 family RNA polymerase sigma factor [Sphaerochaeta sp.]MDD4037576.1 sigma-70 family RNA polymerase sigma factor [Sphaerochaeta sp.]